MTKLHRGVVALMVVATLLAGGCRKEDKWPDSGDADILQAQVLLDSTVKVELRHVADVTIKFLDIEIPEETLVDEEMGGSGSGFVADVRDVSSLVVTASHVCDNWTDKVEVVETMFGKVELTFKTKLHELNVVTIEGEKIKAYVLEDDVKNDTCVVQVDGIAGVPARIADTTPAAGAHLIHTGAPAGLWGKHAGAVVHGTSMGVLDLDELGDFMGMMLSSIGGSSGGPVFYNGAVVGILVRGSYPDGNITFAIQAEYINGALLKARAGWLKKLTQ